MKTISLTDSQARELYPNVSDAIKATLESTFSKEFFSQKITDRVKTLEDVYEITGLEKPADNLPGHVKAYMHICAIAQALNGGWIPDWSDEDQYKYYPWFYLSGFRLGGVDWIYTGSSVGSRLCFQNEDTARYAATQFIEVYKEFMTL